jgi:hypothetical protein
MNDFEEARRAWGEGEGWGFRGHLSQLQIAYVFPSKPWVQVMDTTVGANRKAIAQGTARIVLLPAGKPRFQPGGVDEVSFLGEFCY